MILKCFWMECYQCGFPVASLDWTESFSCLCHPLLCAVLWRAPSWKQPEGWLLYWPCLARRSCVVGYSLWHMCQGVHQNHPTAVQIPTTTCLFCNKADLPGVRGQTELQQGLKATGSKLVLALMFSSVVLIFFSFSSLWGRECISFSSPSSLSPRRVYGGIL